MEKMLPLPHEWMVTSVIGFFISLLQVYPYMSKKWGAAFMLFFILLFIASLITMDQASATDDDIEMLSVRR